MMADGLSFDVIVVGGGTAGCVLASRLSERPGLTVALIEAGRDYGPEGEPEAVLDSYSRAAAHQAFLWPGLRARLHDGAPRVAPFAQARLLGGGSAVMGMQALRGLPQDYDEWAAAGATGWSWSDVQPFFRRIERDCDYRPDEHGDDGPLPVWRRPPEAWPGFTAAVAEALQARGHRLGSDLNAESADGLYPMPTVGLPTRRITSAAAYLGASVRARRNLTILPGTKVERVIFDGTRAVGVCANGPAGSVTLLAREVVISAGAIQSPALLLRSGIGPADDLSRIGVPLVANRPGVGANLLNHPMFTVGFHLRRKARQSAALRPHIHSLLRFSSQDPDCPPGDMYLSILNRTAPHRLGQAIGAISLSVYKSYSHGSVRLRSAEVAEEPAIELGLLSDERDRRRMVDGIVMMLDLLRDPRIAAAAPLPFVPSSSRMTQWLARPSAAGSVFAALLGGLADGSDVLARRIFSLAGDPVPATDDRDAILAIARDRTRPMYHLAGSARMGAVGDPRTVVDPCCRVVGVHGLRVADASIMPTLPRANTFLPVTMIAERAATLFCTDLRS